MCPYTYPRVAIRQGNGGVTPVITSWPDEKGVQVFELGLEVSPGVEHLPEWIEPLGKIIRDLGWTQWCLNSDSVSKVLNRYITEALTAFGDAFFEHYTDDSVVLVQVGLQREAVAHSVFAWEERFKHVRFDNQYDFDTMENSPAEPKRKRSRFSLFKGLPKQRAT
ncbi:MAG: hypothetical protein D6E12_00695 [Desulfovibrio sp.]|nr:MAG: hypothetical protein D6E12_00695 [Desulfovibrio sp.]